MCYFFTKIIKIPAGSQIFGEATFDNTVNNPNNPNNPPQDVEDGESTLDEMMSCRFWVMDYQEGDEDIVLDSSYYTGTSPEAYGTALPLKIQPNPANDKIYFASLLPEHEIQWELVNPIGQVMKAQVQKGIPKGVYANEIDINDLAPGTYFLNVSSGEEKSTAKVVIID
jgi:hypothetical protein